MTVDQDGHISEAIRLEIVRVAPELKRESVARLGEGMDSLAILVGDEFVFRFPKHPEAAIGLRREIALLPRLAPTLPVDIPQFTYFGEHSDTGMPFVGYRILQGEPLDRSLYDGLPKTAQESILRDLATFLDSDST